MSLRMNQQQLSSVLRHGETTYPHECCGILLGKGAGATRTVAEVAPMRNVNVASPRNRFDFDPREHIAVQRQARERGLDIIGFYHSHPDHPARPSQYDLDHASWPGYSYLIVSILAGTGGDANSFELAEDRSQFWPETVEITD